MKKDEPVCPVCGADASCCSYGSEKNVAAVGKLRSILKNRAVRIGVALVCGVVLCVSTAAITAAVCSDAALKAKAASAVEQRDVSMRSELQASVVALRTRAGWEFVSPDRHWRVRNGNDGRWVVEEANRDDASGSRLMEGEGVLLSAAVAGDAFFFSLCEGSHGSTLRCQTLGGAFREFSHVRDVISLAATEEGIATLNSSGDVGVFNPSTGFWHGIQPSGKG